ncbi:MAG: superoxide dismutase [Holosporaceae bacterium]|jgi:Fe-Mn family superoxide dismutase|nr:superoxide dismutase [Holosporaceae bacterium]
MNNFQAQIAHKNTDFVPILSIETIDYHHGKHHCGYAKTLNSLIENTKFADKDLAEIICQSRGIDQKVFNNAAQLFNHDFYWKCLKISKHRSLGKLRGIIENQFNSFDEFLNQYISFANQMFGSGWCWLVWENEKLFFVNTQNAETVIGTNKKAICVVDLWEHAYYIDYRSDRASYINKIIGECINWEFCESQLEAK